MKNYMKLIGKRVEITARESWHKGEWGVVEQIDDDGYFYIAMFGDKNDCPIFERKDFKVCKGA